MACRWESKRFCEYLVTKCGWVGGWDDLPLFLESPWLIQFLLSCCCCYSCVHRNSGCYFYPTNSGDSFAGRAYFGTGGGFEAIEAPLVGPSPLRLDCDTTSASVEGDNGCINYTIASCRAAAEALGLLLGGGGFDFDEGTDSGCYYYPANSASAFAGMAYFGTGGSVEAMEAPLTGSRLRLDCTTSSPSIVGDDECTYYTIDKCRAAAEAQGLAIGGGGFDFVGSFADFGCYYYEPCTSSTPGDGDSRGRAYFGGGGSVADMETTSMSSSNLRLNCNTNVVFPVQDDCIYYTAGECRAAAEALGFDIGGGGFSFEGLFR